MLNLFCDFNLVQHTKGPTDNKGHILDVFITQTSTSVCLRVDPPLISDHSLITGQTAMNVTKTTGTELAIAHQWTNFDIEEFKPDLSLTDLVVNPPTNCSDLLACYDRTHCVSHAIDMHHSVRRSAMSVLSHHGTTNNVISSRSRHVVWRTSIVRLRPLRLTVNGMNSLPYSVAYSTSGTQSIGQKLSSTALIQRPCNPG
jgi:hypothetical protein